ncbi:unnamed protein product, partial [Mesorhabditis spiculigera]
MRRKNDAGDLGFWLFQTMWSLKLRLSTQCLPVLTKSKETRMLLLMSSAGPPTNSNKAALYWIPSTTTTRRSRHSEAETPEGEELAVATLERFGKATEAINTANISAPKTVPMPSSLAELVDEANRLGRDPEALPSSYEPTAGEMCVNNFLLPSCPSCSTHSRVRTPMRDSWMLTSIKKVAQYRQLHGRSSRDRGELEKLNAVEAALDKARKQNANEADNERLLLVLNLQLEQVEQLPLDNVSVEQLDAIEKQLESLKPAGADQVPPQVQAQLDKIAELKARKDKHDADVAQLGAALDDIRKNLNEADKLAHPTKKGKKGKEQAVAPTTDALKEVVAKLENEVLPALAQVNNQAASTPGVEPQLQAANELQAKAQELLADAQKRLDDQMAADEKAARVEAKLLEIMVTPDGIGASKSTAEPPHFHQGKLHNIICSKTLISGDSNEDFKQNLKRLEHAKCFNPKRGSISDLAIANVLLRGPAGAWNSPASNEKL